MDCLSANGSWKGAVRMELAYRSERGPKERRLLAIGFKTFEVCEDRINIVVELVGVLFTNPPNFLTM